MDDYFISLRNTSPPIFLFLREQSSQVNPTRMKRVARKKGEREKVYEGERLPSGRCAI